MYVLNVLEFLFIVSALLNRFAVHIKGDAPQVVALCAKDNVVVAIDDIVGGLVYLEHRIDKKEADEEPSVVLHRETFDQVEPYHPIAKGKEIRETNTQNPEFA